MGTAEIYHEDFNYDFQAEIKIVTQPGFGPFSFKAFFKTSGTEAK